jgi:type II secretory pathway component GspD/PulD (secretin)
MIAKRGWKIARLGLMVVAMVLAISLVCQAATITGFTVRKMEANEKVEIHVNATGALDYRVTSTNKPKQALVVEMPNSTLVANAEKSVPINMGIVERAGMARHSAGVVRLTVNVLQPAKYYIQAAPGKEGFTLVLNTQTVAAKGTKAAPVVKTAPKATTPVAKPAAPPAPVKEVKQAPKTVSKTSKPVAKQAPVKAAPQTVATEKPYTHKNVKAVTAPKKPKVKVIPVKEVEVNFVNADLIYVLKMLANELGVNLVTDNSVTGSVTMSLKKVSAQTALNIVVKLNGFKMKKLGNILFIGSEETINAITPDVVAYQPTGNVKVSAIKLENISAQDAITAIKNAYPMVKADASSANVVVVTANPKMLNEVRSLVKGIDVPAPPGKTTAMVQEKVEVVRLKYAQAKDVQTTLKNLLGTDAPANMEIDERLNALVMKGYETQIERAKAQLDEIDIPLQQVMLSVKVVDLSENATKNLGVNWQIGAIDGTQPIRWYENPIGYAPPAFQAPTQATGTGMPIGFFVRNPFVLQSALSLQVTQGEAKILASPRVAALSGKEATIHIGDKYPIVYYDPRAGQYQVIYVDIGIKLTVKPTISPDGYITTDIDTTVADLRELINNQYPRTTERSAKLVIRVKDNNTIVIGGMVNDSNRTTVSKVPFLGDIPLIGNFFKTRSVDRTRGEVVLMITPKIITQ